MFIHARLSPAAIGPKKKELCDTLEFNETALVRWERGTRWEINDMRAGFSTILSDDVSAVPTRICHT